jgi:hypothetical protein
MNRLDRNSIVFLLVGVLAASMAVAGVETVGEDFQINPPGAASSSAVLQRTRHVDTADDGSFVVVWTSSVFGQATDIAGQRFDAAGNAVGTEFQISETTTGGQHHPSLHYDADGFVVVWTDEPGSPSPQDPIEAVVRCHGPDGDALGGEIPIAEAFDCNSCGTPVARGAAGEYVAVWTGPPDGQFGFAVRGRRLTPDTATATCGDPVAVTAGVAEDDSGIIAASDALRVLQVAVGFAECLACVCDVDGSGSRQRMRCSS